MAVIGLGIDLVDVARAARLMAAHDGKALVRLLTEGERAYLAERANPAPHFAVRVAAKEAVYKALQSLPNARGVGWRDIEVLRGDEGRPSIRLHGLAEQLVAEAGRCAIHLSLSHTGTSAGAVAVLERLD